MFIEQNFSNSQYHSSNNTNLPMRKLLTCILIALISVPVFSQVTFQRNGVYDERPAQYAFKNATIIVDAQTVLENAMIYIKNGVIESVGKDLQVPAGTFVYDLKGKRIYPSLIDIYSDYGLPEIVRPTGGGRGFGGVPQLETNKKGAYDWNQAVKPEVDATNDFKVNAAKAEEMRKNGFGSAAVHSPDGIVRGTSAFVTFGDGRENEVLLKGKASAHYSLDKGTSTQTYPVSAMGSVALLRQTYYDAEWYKKGGKSQERNISLDAFNEMQALPQIYEANDKLGILRGDKIAKEFGVQYIYRGIGDEYQRIDEIKATNSSLIVPLNFPTAYDVEDPFDAAAVSLTEMKHWEMAPANANALTKAGINFAFTSAGLRNKADFWTNIRKAIEYGLPESKALEAITSAPAKLLKVDNMVGSLKKGMIANFIITSENIFSKENVIYENWIQGKRFIISDMNVADIRGVYDLTVGEKTGLKLTITGKPDKPEYQIVIDSTKFTPKVTRMGDLFTISSKFDKKETNDTRLSGYYDGKNFKGEGILVDGKQIKWSAIYKEVAKETTKKDSTKAKTPEIGKIIFPFTAFGNEEKPKQETLLIKNATVWTNEKDGIIANTDVLLQNGKIAQVGKNLAAPTGATTIDGTGKHLTNGIFDEHSHIALLSINEVQSVSAEVRQEDVVNSEDVNIYRQLAGGVTSSQLLHGSADCIGGQSAIIKLKWGENPSNLLIKGADGFIKFALGENVKNGNNPTPSGRYPQTRMGVEQVFIDEFQRAKEYEKAWKDYNALGNKVGVVPPRKDIELDVIVEILNKKRFITCHSYVQSEINMLMKVAELFNFNVNTFTHIMEGYKVADKMKAHGVHASTFSDWWAYKMEVKEAIPYNASIMAKVGVTTAINSDDAEMARRLNQEAAKTILYGGTSEEEAWKMVTLNPAKMLHLDNRLGSIKVGKDADVVLWNNNPLSIYARPEKTIIEGTVYFDSEKDELLQQSVAKERNRIMLKMLAEKTSGAATQRPTPRRNQQIECDTIMENFDMDK